MTFNTKICLLIAPVMCSKDRRAGLEEKTNKGLRTNAALNKRIGCNSTTDTGIDEKDSNGNTELHRATLVKDFSKVRAILEEDLKKESGANLWVKNDKGKTALELAKELNNTPYNIYDHSIEVIIGLLKLKLARQRLAWAKLEEPLLDIDTIAEVAKKHRLLTEG